MGDLDAYLRLNEDLDSKNDQILAQADEILNMKICETSPTKASIDAELAHDFDKLEKKIRKDKTVKDQKTVQDARIPAHLKNTTTSSPISALPGLPESTKNLPAPAQNRLLQARLRVLDTELDKQLDKNAKLSAQVGGQNDKLKELEIYRSSTEKKLASISAVNQKLGQQLDEAKKSQIRVTNEKVNVEKELTKLMREDRSKSSKTAQQEARLNRAVEEMEKYKNEMVRLKKEGRENASKDGVRNDDLIHENRRLQRLVEDQQTCIKKQFKLIDILKQQKMHLEAARNLQFTEQEWQKVLDSSVSEHKAFF